MTIEEVARQEPPSGGSPDTEVFGKKFEREYLDNQQNYVAENSNFVSGEYGHRGGGTTRPPCQAVFLTQKKYTAEKFRIVSNNVVMNLLLRQLSLLNCMK